jgi:hypothetical protein
MIPIEDKINHPELKQTKSFKILLLMVQLTLMPWPKLNLVKGKQTVQQTLDMYLQR